MAMAMAWKGFEKGGDMIIIKGNHEGPDDIRQNSSRPPGEEKVPTHWIVQRDSAQYPSAHLLRTLPSHATQTASQHHIPETTVQETTENETFSASHPCLNEPDILNITIDLLNISSSLSKPGPLLVKVPVHFIILLTSLDPGQLLHFF
ncbi:hypothetical protein HYFRA_00014195 [Hymenoscyphus fraxineus]|uniref:Uncharacterized protein n=1 Tax=Hymenoscyphus fraxineus TaxID=746836 RepID=A0A9N9Q0G4_9HELO|nr:hypothetical protein HYFRA_00014195 [Hymenoscyphus fraxineus]